MIIGTVGRLGKGKTMSGVIEAYSDFCEDIPIFSNIWLSFPHTPIKNPYDLFLMENGFFLADEFWHMADNRKSKNLLNDVVTIICLRSRKRGFDVFYTQQFLQIDIRIRFITDYWVKPKTFPDAPATPVRLDQEIFDADLNPLTPRRYGQEELNRFFDMYNTRQDPYTLEAFVTEHYLRKVIDRALKIDPEIKRDLKEVEIAGLQKRQTLDKVLAL